MPQNEANFAIRTLGHEHDRNARFLARALFGNPTRAQGQISPDGRWLSWLAPKDGVLNIWVAPAGDIDAARVITDDRKRGIRFHGWANNSTHVLYIQDEGGTEDWHVYAVTVDERRRRATSRRCRACNARMQGLSLDEPDVVAVGLNDRDKAWHDVYRVDIRTGERELLFENRKELAGIVLDRQLRPAAGHQARAPRRAATSSIRIDGTELEPMMVVEHEDDLTTHPIGFTRDGRHSLLDLVGRPRQGGAARHGLADRQRSRARPSTPRPTSAA